MKILILAAGKGVRLRPLTLKRPKPLIEINGKPFLSYLLENINEAGFRDIGVVVNYKKEMIIDFLKENGIEAEIIPQPKLLGTGNAILCAEKWANGEEFVVVNGDCLYSSRDMAMLRKKNGLNYVVATFHNNPERYGVIIEKDGMLERIVEKPKVFVGNKINTGLYKFTKDIFDALRKIRVSERGEYEVTDAINILCKDGRVKVVNIIDYWLELGKISDIKVLEKVLRN